MHQATTGGILDCFIFCIKYEPRPCNHCALAKAAVPYWHEGSKVHQERQSKSHQKLTFDGHALICTTTIQFFRWVIGPENQKSHDQTTKTGHEKLALLTPHTRVDFRLEKHTPDRISLNNLTFDGHFLICTTTVQFFRWVIGPENQKSHNQTTKTGH